MYNKVCVICPTVFKTTQRHKRYCCPRCAYIGAKLRKPAAKNMSREEAIVYYGTMYDDPFRTIGRTKHKDILKCIYVLCQRKGSTTFTTGEVSEIANREISPRTIAAIQYHHNVVRMTGEKVMNLAGTKKVAEWEFMLK